MPVCEIGGSAISQLPCSLRREVALLSEVASSKESGPNTHFYIYIYI